MGTREEKLNTVLTKLIGYWKEITSSAIASLWFYDPKTKTLCLKKEFSSDRKEMSKGLGDNGIAPYIARTQNVVVTDEVRYSPTSKDGRIIYDVSSEKLTGVMLRQLIGVPVIGDKREILGVIYAINNPNGYTDLDVTIIQLLSGFVARCIQNAREKGEIRELDSALEQMIGLTQQIKAAARLQEQALPSLPKINEYDISSFSMLSCGLGGDYYLFTENKGSLVAVIGDVASHGIKAAITASSCLEKAKMLLDDPRYSGVEHMREFLKRFNETHHPEVQSTMSYSIFNPDGIFYHLAAGHHPPLIFNPVTGKSRKIRGACGAMFGAFDGEAFQEQLGRQSKHKLREGEICMAYTDGVTDICGRTKKMYGKRGIINCVRKCVEGNENASSEQIVHAIKRDLRAYAGVNVQKNDDATLILVRKK